MPLYIDIYSGMPLGAWMGHATDDLAPSLLVYTLGRDEKSSDLEPFNRALSASIFFKPLF